jgi:hypothetical protein
VLLLTVAPDASTTEIVTLATPEFAPATVTVPVTVTVPPPELTYAAAGEKARFDKTGATSKGAPPLELLPPLPPPHATNRATKGNKIRRKNWKSKFRRFMCAFNVNITYIFNHSLAGRNNNIALNHAVKRHCSNVAGNGDSRKQAPRMRR